MAQRPDDPFGFDDEERDSSREKQRVRGRVVPEFVRRAIENTVSSVGSTTNLSRDAFDAFDKGRKELMRMIAHEVGDFLKHADLSGEIVKIMSALQVEVNATVRFRPAEPGAAKESSASPENTTVRPSAPPPGIELSPDPSIRISIVNQEKESRGSVPPPPDAPGPRTRADKTGEE